MKQGTQVIRGIHLKPLKQKQQGFIGAIFVAIALLAIVGIAIGLMSRSSNGSANDQTAKTHAAVILKQASDMKIGFDILTIKISPSDVQFNTDTTYGLFNPTPGAQYAVKHTPPAGAIATGTPEYFMNSKVKLPDVGDNAGADVVLVVPNVSKAVCGEINKALYNDAGTSFGASTGTIANWNSNTAIDDSGKTADVLYDKRAEGCVESADAGKYVYYKALSER